MPVGLVERRLPVRVGMHPDCQVGSRAAIAELREAALVECGRAVLQATDVLAPRGDGVRLVEPNSLSDGRPEPFHVGLAEHDTCPAFVRVGHDRPVAEPVGQLQGLLVDLAHPGPADAHAVQVGEQLRFRVSRDRTECAARLAQIAEPRHEPRRRVAQEFAVGQFDVSAPDVLVGVEDVDVPRPGGVGRPRDRAGERRMLDQRVDPQDLTGLEVQPDLDDELRVPLEPLVGVRHGGEL